MKLEPPYKPKNRRRWFRVTVEPTFVLYSFAETIMQFLYQNLLLQKSCRVNVTREPNLETDCDDEEAGLKFVARVNSTFLTTATFASCLYATLATSWSDQAGKRRRPIIFIPLVGMLFETGFAILQTYFWHWSAYLTVYTKLFGQLIFGGHNCIMSAMFLYVIDVTDDSNRSFRYGLLMAIRHFIRPLGFFVSGFLLRSFGFFYLFLTCFLLIVAAVLLGARFIYDVSEPTPQKLSFWTMINPKHAFKSIEITFRRRRHNSRMLIVMLLVAFNIFVLTTEGEYSVLFLYFRRQFRWSEQKIGAYLAYKLWGSCAGVIICSMILAKSLKMEESIIGIFIAIAKLLAAVCYVFATEEWQLYVILLIDLYYAASMTVTRLFATKFVERNEYGHMSSVITLSRMFVPVSQSLYNFVFVSTLNTSFPSCFFVISVFCSLIILILMITSNVLYRKQNTKIEEDNLVQ